MKRFLPLALLAGTAATLTGYSYTWSPTAKWGPFPIPSPSGEIVWMMNAAGTPDIAGGPATGDGEVVPIKAALLDWEDATGGNLDLEYGGSTPATSALGDGINCVQFVSPWTGGAGVLGLGGSMIGGAGSITEGFVSMNDDILWSSTDLVEGIFLHEVGHALGLGHSTDSSAVMAPVYSGENDPQPDDIAGMTGLYGTGSGGDGVDSPGGPPPPPPPPPPGPPPGPAGGSASQDNDRGGNNHWCIVATAACGTEHSRVDSLRAFRDRSLNGTGSGSSFARLYRRSALGPATVVGRSEVFRAVVRRALFGR